MCGWWTELQLQSEGNNNSRPKILKTFRRAYMYVSEKDSNIRPRRDEQIIRSRTQLGESINMFALLCKQHFIRQRSIYTVADLYIESIKKDISILRCRVWMPRVCYCKPGVINQRKRRGVQK